MTKNNSYDHRTPCVTTYSFSEIARKLGTGFASRSSEHREAAVRQATANGLAAIDGNATRSSVLNEADVKNCKAVIIATDSDEASVLITLTVRQLTAGQVRIIGPSR